MQSTRKEKLNALVYIIGIRPRSDSNIVFTLGRRQISLAFLA